MGLHRCLLPRGAQIIPVALVVVVLNFTLIHLAPGDIARVLAGEGADPDHMNTVRASHGLDQCFWRSSPAVSGMC